MELATIGNFALLLFPVQMLNNHTYYSHGYGTLHPEELIKLAKGMGWQTVVLTDINTTAAVLDFLRLAEEQGVRPVVGIDFRDGVEQQFVALARDNEGFREMNEYLSLVHGAQPFKGSEPLEGLEKGEAESDKHPCSTLKGTVYSLLQRSD